MLHERLWGVLFSLSSRTLPRRLTAFFVRGRSSIPRRLKADGGKEGNACNRAFDRWPVEAGALDSRTPMST